MAISLELSGLVGRSTGDAVLMGVVGVVDGALGAREGVDTAVAVPAVSSFGVTKTAPGNSPVFCVPPSNRTSAPPGVTIANECSISSEMKPNPPAIIVSKKSPIKMSKQASTV